MDTWKWPWAQNTWPTAEELWKGLNEAPAEERRTLLDMLIAGSQQAVKCMEQNHDIEVRALKEDVRVLRYERDTVLAMTAPRKEGSDAG